MTTSIEKLFATDVLSKRERVERTLNHQEVDRCALHEQLSYNPGVIALYTGQEIQGFEYTVDDICRVIRLTLDMCFPPVAPRGTGRRTTRDGFVIQDDQWTGWHVSRPFTDEHGAADWLKSRIRDMELARNDVEAEGARYGRMMTELQSRLGETVILNYSNTGFCHVFDRMGLEIFTFFAQDNPGVLEEYMDVRTRREVRRIHAVADRALSPVILVPEDFSSKQGPIFGPEFLGRFHYPFLRRVVEAWHAHDVKVLYHSDGNYRSVIPALIACGVDGFYCLEPNCGMDIVELKQQWPRMVWAGGLDGVDLMERGTPEQVRQAVRRQVVESHALRNGGLFVASSSEINPPIKPANFRAMVEAVGECRNADFGPDRQKGSPSKNGAGRMADERGEPTPGLPAPPRELP